jgi:magnesium transporter
MHMVTALGDDGKLVIGDDALLDRPGPRWIDVIEPRPEEMEDLRERLGIHRLAVEDCLKLGQRPKLEEYPNHPFLVLQGYGPGATVATPKLREVHFILFPDLLITVHEDAREVVDEARRRLSADPPTSFARGPDFIAYAVADALVDGNFPVVEALDAEIEALEDEVFVAARADQLPRMADLRRALVDMRRVLSPQRDVLALLSRRGTTLVQERTTLYFRDIYDHLIRLIEQLDAARDLLASARDAWLSVIANRTNDITKQLTIFATIFLPLAFITGFFGQNFDVLTHPVFFWLMLGTIVGVPVVLVAWFRHKHWI